MGAKSAEHWAVMMAVMMAVDLVDLMVVLWLERRKMVIKMNQRLDIVEKREKRDDYRMAASLAVH